MLFGNKFKDSKDTELEMLLKVAEMVLFM